MRRAHIASGLLLSIALLGAASCKDEQVRSVPDNPLRLLELVPADSDAEVPRMLAGRARFSAELDPRSITAESITLEAVADASPVELTLSVDSRGDGVEIRSTEALAPFADYRLALLDSIRALDGNALEAPAVARFRTVDDLPPSAPGTPEDEGVFSTIPRVRFNWTPATDEGSGVARYRLRVGTTPAGADVFDDALGGNLSASVDGNHGQTLYARVSAIDAVEQQSAWSGDSDGITIDTTPPPAPQPPDDGGPWQAGPQVRFVILPGSDPESGVTAHRLQIGRTPQGAGVLDMELSAEVLEWEVEATHGETFYARAAARNGAGSWGAASPSSAGVTVDALPPEVSASDVESTDTSPGLSGTAVDADSGVAELRLRLAGAEYGPLERADDRWFLSRGEIDPPLEPGQYDFEVTATDAVGNSASTTAQITVLPGSPGALLAPRDNGDWDDAAVVFTWAPPESDAVPVASYEIEVGTAPELADVFAGDLGAASVDVRRHEIAGVHGQSYFARVRAISRAGLEGPWSPSSDGVTVDIEAPLAEVDALRSSHPRPALSGRVSDSESGVAAIQLTLAGQTLLGDDIAVDSAQGRWSVAEDTLPQDLPDGTHDLVLRVTDAAGNSGSDASVDEIFVDASPPTRPGTPMDEGAIDDREVTFRWAAAEDPHSGVVDYRLQAGTTPGSAELFDARIGEVPTQALTFAVGVDVSEGTRVYARVAAINGVDLQGPWSLDSDGIRIDARRPEVIDWGPQGENVDTVVTVFVRFSEPMDPSTLAGAFSFAPAAHPGELSWNESFDRLTLVPDVADPVGVDNVDVLFEDQRYQIAISDAARDTAGNPLLPFAGDFRTVDRSPPELIGVFTESDANADVTSVARQELEAGDTLRIRFNEALSEETLFLELRDHRERPIVGRYRLRQEALLASDDGNTAVYELAEPHGLSIGDRVRATDFDPPSLNRDDAEVIAVLDALRFAVASTAPADSVAPGYVHIDRGHGGEVEFTAPEEITLTLGEALIGGLEYRLVIEKLWDNTRENEGAVSGVLIQARNLRPAGDPLRDEIAPFVISTVPGDGATEVDVLSPIKIVFSEAAEKLSIQNMQVSSVAATPAVTEADFQGYYESTTLDGHVAIFTPRRKLPAGATLTVTVHEVVVDLADNRMPAPHSFSFTVGGQTDLAPPVVLSTWPAEGATDASPGMPIELRFVDGQTGLVEALDGARMDARDLEVFDLTEGRALRGWTVQPFDFEGRMRLHAGADSQALNWGERGERRIVDAVASGGRLRYEVDEDHGYEVGDELVVIDSGNPAFDVEFQPIVAVPSPRRFEVAGAGAGSVSAGLAQAYYPRRFRVRVGIGEGRGGRGYRDMAGNFMAEHTLQFTVPTPPNNHGPTIDEAGAVGRSAPAYRNLGAAATVLDTDGDPVSVRVDDPRDAEIFDFERQVQGEGGAAFGRVGIPFDDMAQFNRAEFSETGTYALNIAVDDGRGGEFEAPYQYFLWRPEDAPRFDTVAGVEARADRTLVIGEDQPELRWRNVDLAHADQLRVELRDWGGAQDGEYNFGTLLGPEDAGLTLPPHDALPPGVYNWGLIQQRHGPGMDALLGEAYALDFSQPSVEMFIVNGPGNAGLDGRRQAVAELGLRYDWLGRFELGWSRAGSWDLLAPSNAEHSWTDQGGRGGGETWHFGTDAAQSAIFVGPLAGYGLRGAFEASGEVAVLLTPGDPLERSFALACDRPQASGFTPDLLDGPWAAVMLGVSLDPSGLASVEGLQGELRMAPPVADTTLVDLSGRRANLAATGITVAGDGAVELQLGARHYQGLICGGAGEELLLLSADDDEERPALLILARHRSLSGDSDASLQGRYRFFDFELSPRPGALPQMHSARGIMDFDGAGGIARELQRLDFRKPDTGSYSVDAAADRLEVDAFTLIAGAANRYFGLALGDSERLALRILLPAP